MCWCLHRVFKCICVFDEFSAYERVVRSVYSVSAFVCVEFYREEPCVGEENVELNYVFFSGEGCIYIYVCVYVGDGQNTHCMYVH